MAITLRTVEPPPLLGGRRLVEWGAVALLLLALVGFFQAETRRLQGLNERASVQSTLGALRTALVLSYVVSQITPPGSSAARGPQGKPVANPFVLLERVPINFAGEHRMGQADTMVPGTWVVDADCGCVGYRMVYAGGLDEPIDGAALWFRISGPAEARFMAPITRYVWQGQVIR